MRWILAPIAVAALLAAASPAAAIKRTHHGDPVKVFKKYKKRPAARASAFSSAFAADWPCTGDTTLERPPVISSNAPQVKVIYAYPTDVPSDFTTADSVIQSDAKAVRDRIANELGSDKTVRFDTGAAGGTCDGASSKNYLDIRTVALSGVASSYDFRTLTNELKTKLGALTPGSRVNYVVYAEGIQSHGAAGEADLFPDDSKSLVNVINQGSDGDGRLFAVVYGRAGNTLANLNASARQATFLHELTHTLGAVQDSAPHSSQAGHCLDEADIMCYDDDGPGVPDPDVCIPVDSAAFSELYDCNRDDYFNPSPAADTYLAQKWNSYDSVFLCKLTECDATLTPPDAPSLASTHVNGKLALEATGVTGIAHYEWDLDGDGFYDEETGTAPTITPVWERPGSREVRVRASKADGTFSSATVSVAPTDPSPQLSVLGKTITGEVLQLDGTKTTDPDGLITKYRWDLDGDGSYETDTGLTQTAQTSFGTPGLYSVGLQVDYGYGYAWTRTGSFQILEPPAIPPPVATPNAPAVAFSAVRIRKLLSRGFPISVRCGAPCKVSFSLSIDARTAKKLKLRKRLGSVRMQFAAGSFRPVIKLPSRVKRALRKVRSLTVAVAGTVTQGALPPLKVAKKIKLKR